MKEIRRIIKAYDAIDFNQERVALAAVVNVEESSYRRIGARMLVKSTGIWTGGISGGCLEGDALKRSQLAIFKNQSSKVVYDTMEDDKNQIGVGLGCNGRIEVLFTPIDPHDPNNEIELLRRIIHAENPSILLKIIDAPTDSDLLGTMQLLDSTDQEVDFAGIAPEVLQDCIAETLKRKKPRTFECLSGETPVKLLVEFIRPETRLIIVGDNYDVNAMTGVAEQLGWEIYIVGKMKKLSKQIYQSAQKVVDYDGANKLGVHDYTAVILMSHDYNWDKAMLPVFVDKRPKYIGMLGPKKRFLKMQKELPQIDFDAIDFFFSPTGLEIGAESPNEIALSIAAEIVATFRNKQGTSLKWKEGTIHERD